MSLVFDDPTRSEYIEIGGLVLATPAWECVDISALYDTPAVRGDDATVPYHDGVMPFRRIVGARRAVLPMMVYGDYDREGSKLPDGRLGLRQNLDDLKRELLRPAQNSADGTRLLRHVFSDGEVRQAPCHVILPLQVGMFSPIAVKATLDVSIPGGVLRSAETQGVSTGLIAAGDTVHVTVPNSGTADQFASTIRLTGSTTDITIKNLSWDPSGGTSLRYGESVADGITADTGALSAVNDLGDDVSGNFFPAGHPLWLPMQPGPNELEISISATGTAIVEISHYPAWL